MANPQLSHMPSGDFSIARKVMDDAVAFHLANGGPTVARQHVEQLANELKFYSDINEAYLDAMARIAEAERTGRQPSRRAQTGPNGKAQPAQKGVLPPKLASGRGASCSRKGSSTTTTSPSDYRAPCRPYWPTI